jgi:hypothetical protein
MVMVPARGPTRFFSPVTPGWGLYSKNKFGSYVAVDRRSVARAQFCVEGRVGVSAIAIEGKVDKEAKRREEKRRSE